MVVVDFNILHAAPIAKLGARKMESYRLPFWRFRAALARCVLQNKNSSDLFLNCYSTSTSRAR